MTNNQSDLKHHQDQTYLQQKISDGYTSKDISKELKVSYHLVEIYLRKYGIKHVSQVQS
jgi:DNA-binding CsgD family transcriptional regulator